MVVDRTDTLTLRPEKKRKGKKRKGKNHVSFGKGTVTG